MSVNTTPKIPYQISFTHTEVNDWAKTAMDPLVVHIQLGSKTVQRVLVETGSSSDILYWDAFLKLGFEQSHLRPTNCTLVGFGGERVKALGRSEERRVGKECRL